MRRSVEEVTPNLDTESRGLASFATCHTKAPAADEGPPQLVRRTPPLCGMARLLPRASCRPLDALAGGTRSRITAAKWGGVLLLTVPKKLSGECGAEQSASVADGRSTILGLGLGEAVVDQLID
jgi:hypothetical protein